MKEKRCLRVGVVEEGRQFSAIWRIWKQGDDIYVAARSIARTFKTSLHASGRYRHAFTSSKIAEEFRGYGADRAVSKWLRPTPQVPNATLLFQILIPDAGLEFPRIPFALPEGLTKLPRPGPGCTAYVSIIDASSEFSPMFESGGSERLASWPNGQGVTVVIMHSEKNTPDHERTLEDVRTKVLASNARLSSVESGEPFHLRVFALLQNSDGIGKVLDYGAEFARGTGSLFEQSRNQIL